MTDLEMRFWSKVRIGDGCWEWLASLNKDGYGNFHVKGIGMTVAHRVSMSFGHGPLETWMYVCHRCDNPKCVRPSHLFIGTQKDNMRDCKAKGRIARTSQLGETHGRSTLSESTVRAIRDMAASGETQRTVAKKFGISQGHVSDIVNRRYWGHLD